VRNNLAVRTDSYQITSRCTATGPPRQVALMDNDWWLQIIRKWSISADEMYLMICVEWSGLDVNRSTFDEDIQEKQFLHFCSHWPWPFNLRITSPFSSIWCNYPV